MFGIICHKAANVSWVTNDYVKSLCPHMEATSITCDVLLMTCAKSLDLHTTISYDNVLPIETPILRSAFLAMIGILFNVHTVIS